MTAVATRPASPPAGGPEAPATGRRGSGTAPLTLWVELALFGVTATAVAGMARLFADASFLLPLLLVAATGHLCAAVARRRRLGPVATIALGIGAGVVVLVLVDAPGHTLLGLPAPGALGAAAADLRGAWREFGEVVAPAPVLPGFVLASGLAVWAVAWFSDWAALRVGALVESVLPAASLFLFASMLGQGPHRVTATLAFLAAVGVFAVVQRTDRLTRSTAWVGDLRAGRRAWVLQGLALVAVAVALAGAVGPQLPGAGSPPVIDWKGDRDRPSTRITVSPLVDIRSRLVDQSDVEVFSVRATRRSYWRLTSLDSFDGSVWTSSGRFGAASGDLPGDAAPDGSTRSVQDFRISGLSSIWLPAAYEARAVATDGSRVRFDEDSSTLIVDDDRPTSDGITYRVTSALPHLTSLELQAGLAPVPPTIVDRYTGLPVDFPVSVRNLATAIGRTATTSYGKALALQSYFRDNFTYDLRGTAAGHSDRAIETFLASGKGYCEQFAGTFAAMARVLGIPSRVAVGFTPGEPDGRGRFVVRGRHAHAWPEVWLGQAGWVAFEPTPDRGAPGAEDYTGVREQQDGTTPGQTTSTTTTSTTLAPSRPTATTQPSDQSQVASQGGADGGGRGGAAPSVARRAGAGLAVLVLALVAWVGALAGAAELRRRRRRRRASSPAARVGVSWAESTEAVARVTAARRPSETHREFADRAGPMVGPAAEPLDRLARLAEAAAWAPDDAPAAAAVEADALRAQVDGEVKKRVDTRQRAREAVDPRSLLRP